MTTSRILLVAGLLALAPIRAGAGPSIQVVETVPVETGMNRPEVPDARDVWPEKIAAAVRTLDLAAFYVSNRPGSALEPVLLALEAAGARGVRVRVLADRGFYRTYPASLDRLAAAGGIEVRLIDYGEIAGGVMHAKYFIADGKAAYVGSQNFDWRALEHIHEMGLWIEVPDYARELTRVFAMDWALGERIGGPPPPETEEEPGPAAAPPYAWLQRDGATGRFWPAFSPYGHLPDSTSWDLPRILRAVDGARDSVHVTLLTYNPVARDGSYWDDLDAALRRAAVRGVQVRLLVSDWSKTHPKIDFLKSLQMVPGIEVRMLVIPEASEGFLPFARVTHAKYMTVDGTVCWLGTGNWEKSYFTTSRNVGVLAESGELTGDLDADFQAWWGSRFAETVRPEVEYEPRRVSD